MERHEPIALDLDEVEAEIKQRWFVWTAAGLKVHPVTRTDTGVMTPRSLALNVSQPGAHAHIVLSITGRADVTLRRPEAGADVHETARVGAVEAFGQLLDRVIELITWNGVPRDPGSAAGHFPRTERAAHWVLGFDGAPWSIEP